MIWPFLLCVCLFDSSVYKNPIGDAFEESSEQAHLLVIYGMKLASPDPKNLIFGCRDIQGRVMYKFCVSGTLRSGVILNLNQYFNFGPFCAGIFSLALTWTYNIVVFWAALLPGRSARLQNPKLNKTHGRNSPWYELSNGVKLEQIQYYSGGDLTILTLS